MKILHILNANERNSLNLFTQLYEKFDLTNHSFVVLNYEDKVERIFPNFYKLPNLIYLSETNLIKKSLDLYKLMFAADKIIFHSLIFNTNKFVLFFAIFKRFLKKSVWVEWGADLYNWKRPEVNLKNKFLNFLNFRVRKTIPAVGLTFLGDKNAVVEQFGDKQFFDTPLPFGTERIDLIKDVCMRTRDLKHKSIRIQVAHNALPINNHYSILEKLEKFALHDIQLILPLSYGTFGLSGQFKGLTYRNNLITVANLMFPKKTLVLKKEIDLKFYLNYLNNIDILVFDCDRPIALANIYYAYMLGKKIFASKTSPQYQFYLDHGLKVFATDDIPHMTFDEFIKNDLTPAFDKEGQLLDIPPLLYNKFFPYKDILNWGKLFDFLNSSK